MTHKKPPTPEEARFKKWTQSYAIYDMLLKSFGKDVSVDSIYSLAGPHIVSTSYAYAHSRIKFISRRLERMDCGFTIILGEKKRSFRLVRKDSK